ncbi:hypothetical protein YK48G_11460 [Lentilactobacillus fungorum]|uniref:Uncharacterized protein n=1 Tax=Lentilactobacillus fungorum TaxID=2201250 RepID=A0ABQ3W0B4_9LACO|nr:hypothetical protein YK48G_11460 [Lentilactobacillus fungorum]
MESEIRPDNKNPGQISYLKKVVSAHSINDVFNHIVTLNIAPITYFTSRICPHVFSTSEDKLKFL